VSHRLTASDFLRDLNCTNLAHLQVARDEIGKVLSTQLISGDQTLAKTMSDLRAILRAAYCIGITKGFPIREIVISAREWPKSVHTFFKLIDPISIQLSAQEKKDWETFSAAGSWRLDTDYTSSRRDVLVALLAVCPSYCTTDSVEQIEALLDTPNALYDHDTVMREIRSFSDRYQLGERLGIRQLENAVDAERTVHGGGSSSAKSAISRESVVARATEALHALARLVGIAPEDTGDLIDAAANRASLLGSTDNWRDLFRSVWQEAVERSRQKAEQEVASLPASGRVLVENLERLVGKRAGAYLCAVLSMRDSRARLIISMKLRGEAEDKIAETICVSRRAVLRVVDDFKSDLYVSRDLALSDEERAREDPPMPKVRR
jgi:hypothetical protein